MATKVAPGSGGLQDALPTTLAALPQEELPELLPADFRLYNKLAELMEYYVGTQPFGPLCRN